MSKTFKINIDRTSIEDNPNGTPKYLYKYLNTPMKCDGCDNRFMSIELVFIENWDNLTPSGCPKCDKWNCCEIKYEKIEDIRL